MCIRRNTFCITASLLFTFQTSLPLSRAISLKDSLFIISPCLKFVKPFFQLFLKTFQQASLPSSDTTLSVYHTSPLLSSTFFNFFKLFSHLSLRCCPSSDSLHSISPYPLFVNTFFLFFIFFYSFFIPILYLVVCHFFYTLFIPLLSQIMTTTLFTQEKLKAKTAAAYNDNRFVLI